MTLPTDPGGSSSALPPPPSDPGAQRISPQALRVRRSGIREIVNLALAAGPEVVRLELGEPDFDVPPHVLEAAQAAAAAGSGYVQSAGTPALREAAVTRLARDHGLQVDPAHVVVCQGAGQGLSAVMAAVVGPGDEVLVPDPGWPNYEMQVLLAGGRPVRYRLRAQDGYQPDPDEIADLLGLRTKAIVINSPSNPTGATWGSATVRRVVELAARAGVLVVSDEVYDEIRFEGEAATAAALDRENVVGVYSLSKTYAMTGWRVGYLVLPPWLAPKVGQLQEPLLSCVSSVTQAAGVAALLGPQESVGEMVAVYRARRDAALVQLAGAGLHPVTPTGAFYLMVPLAPRVDSRLAALALVTEGVAVAPGGAFGDVAASSLRISLASSQEDLRTGIARLTDWLARTDAGAALAAQH